MKLRRLLTSLLAAATTTLIVATPVQAGPVSGQGTWETTLLGRDINRNAVDASSISAVYLYDTSRDITWLKNANANGAMIWSAAVGWAAGLSMGSGTNVIDDWRLPTLVDTGTPGCNFSLAGGTDCGFNVLTASSEMAHLWYDELGNKAVCTPGTSCIMQPGSGLTNTGNFLNMQSHVYWSGLEYAPNTVGAWLFNSLNGVQDATSKYGLFYALAVRPGDVLAATVPEPGTLVLAALALAGLGFGRRRLAHRFQ